MPATQIDKEGFVSCKQQNAVFADKTKAFIFKANCKLTRRVI